MKYFAISTLFLLNNEIFSIIALLIMVIMLLCDMVKERFYS